MTTTHVIPATRNEVWGFWGTMEGHAPTAWPLAMNAIAEATGQPVEAVRVFLDSRHGRHFADDVQSGLYRGQPLTDAIHAATEQWMGWTIGRQTSKQYGIPRGLPYLTGFVIHCEIIEEEVAA
ncbi:hypothetical protein B4966_10555 [Rhodocyclaceae bacterium]|jgi:hypothetical protein|nr:hypothetical protein B4966_10555 [Rhodocyclaceae bacterium]